MSPTRPRYSETSAAIHRAALASRAMTVEQRAEIIARSHSTLSPNTPMRTEDPKRPGTYREANPVIRTVIGNDSRDFAAHSIANQVAGYAGIQAQIHRMSTGERAADSGSESFYPGELLIRDVIARAFSLMGGKDDGQA